MVAWFDSHCHVHDEEDPADLLARAGEAGVEGVVVVGTDLASSRRAVEVARAHEGVWAAVGLHPHDASRLDDEWAELSALAAAPEVVGVGESGFDFHYMHSPPGTQEEAFRRHIGLAGELGKALVIHTREAWDDTFRVLDAEGVPERTVFHCFTGGPGEARACLERGTALSFSGIVTFKGARDVQEAAALVPPERLLVETDSPYLAPHPHRGRRNEPALVVHVGEQVAALTGRPIAGVAVETATAARRLFGLTGASA